MNETSKTVYPSGQEIYFSTNPEDADKLRGAMVMKTNETLRKLDEVETKATPAPWEMYYEEKFQYEYWDMVLTPLMRNNLRALIDIAIAAEVFHAAWAEGTDLVGPRNILGHALAKLGDGNVE